MRQGLLAFAPGFFSRHRAQLTFVRFLRSLAWACLEWDQGCHNQEIVFSDAILGAKPRYLFVALHVVLDQHRENSLRPRLPLSLKGLNPSGQSINSASAHCRRVASASMRSQMALIVCRTTVASSSFQLIKTSLEPLHGDRLEHIPHAPQRVDQPGPVRDFRRALPHFSIDTAHFFENASQAIEVPNPRSRSGLAGSALPFCLRCNAFASVKKAAHVQIGPRVATSSHDIN
jgi:hypothetical protein